ncbi:uncharacterized protein KD926_006806 [Aspergillus affinis]|uniref:uncharacterized protein n=1 Tax=Aspergillus affinis TaxID=1070780 RepID=UPI0022FE4A82|nr:uncharacterized protein KD926_006806 [Aspergillus affinis]KAI9041410.1 hypothetical protein KD926_006806 [Aspergillus affinis]
MSDHPLTVIVWMFDDDDDDGGDGVECRWVVGRKEKQELEALSSEVEDSGVFATSATDASQGRSIWSDISAYINHPDEELLDSANSASRTPHNTFIPHVFPGQPESKSSRPAVESPNSSSPTSNARLPRTHDTTGPAVKPVGEHSLGVAPPQDLGQTGIPPNLTKSQAQAPLPQDSFDPFDDFANFLDLIGFPADWAPLDLEIESPLEGLDALSSEPHAPGESHSDDSPFKSWLPSVPSLGHGEYAFHDADSYHVGDNSSTIRVDEYNRSYLMSLLETYKDILPNFRLPSRHTLTRYITSFFQGFHNHLLFIHLPTFRLNDQSPEFMLAMMAAGAQYRFEHQNAQRFFTAAKAIVLQKIDPTFRDRRNTGISEPTKNGRGIDNMSEIDLIRTLLVLMGYSTWECGSYLQDAFQLRDLLISILRTSGLDETDQDNTEQGQLNWRSWILQETIRRTKLAAIFFTQVHSVAYNLYPTIRNNEVKLHLPCPTKLWNATNPYDWDVIMKLIDRKQAFYHHAVSQLLRDTDSVSVIDPTPSPLGSYYILHGLLQRIHIVRELAVDLGDSAALLPSDELNRLERALNLWSTMWQQAPESNLDPSNENGPIPFTSSSLLAMAYVRLSLNIGPYKRLESRDPDIIAKALSDLPPVWRCARLTPALIYAIHTVSVPVRLGLDYIAKSQAFFWSVRHALASFECVILLSKWLRAVAVDQNGTLNTNEKRIIRWARLVVEEAYDSMDTAEGEVPGREPAELAAAVLGIWSRFFKQNSQWKFINILGESLERYAQLQMSG